LDRLNVFDNLDGIIMRASNMAFAEAPLNHTPHGDRELATILYDIGIYSLPYTRQQ